MLLYVMIEERPQDASAGPALLRFLNSANAFIYNHFWLSVNFPALAPGTPD
jgi:hypothetical protein